MGRITFKLRVGPDGRLHMDVPIGAADANREVEVTIEPAGAPPTQEEWRNFILATAGSVADPTFVRHAQGEFERRESLP